MPPTVPTPAETTESTLLNFSTSNQSIWNTGPAESFSDSWTLLSASTGTISKGFSVLGFGVRGSVDASAALVANVSATTGGLNLDYPLNADVTMPSIVAPGQQFTIDTSADGLNGSDLAFSAMLPHFTASLDLDVGVKYSLSTESFGSWTNLASGTTGKDITLFSTASPSITLSAGGFGLTFTLPASYDSETTSIGTGNEPTVTLEANTAPVISISTDILADIEKLLPPPFDNLVPAGSYGIIGYDLVGLILKGGAGLAQKFTFDPTGVEEMISTPWGQDAIVPLGQDATFTTPQNWSGPVNLTTQYIIDGVLKAQTGINASISLDVTFLSGTFDGHSFGPLYSYDIPLYSHPFYFYSNEFQLGGFSSISEQLTIALGNGDVTLPGNDTIDATGFTANATAVIETVLTNTATAIPATATNIYDPVTSTGSKTAIAKDLNVEVITGTAGGTYTLPTGFQAAVLEPGTGNATLVGNATDVLLAAAPASGDKDTIQSVDETDTLVGGQDGGVTFTIGTNFTGEIVGLTGNDTIAINGLTYNKSSSSATLGANNVLTVTEGGSTVTIHLNPDENFLGTAFKTSLGGKGTIITLDPPPAAPSTPVLAAASDSGVKGDGITNVTTPTITGTGVAGDTVTLEEEEPGQATVVLGTDKVAGSGDWSIKTSTLAQGTYTLVAIEADTVGATSEPSGALTLKILTTPPPAPGNLKLDPSTNTGLPGDNVTSVDKPEIDGTGTAGDTVTLYSGTTVVGTATVGNNGDWTVTTSVLLPGKYSLTATQTDVAGNVGTASSPLSITIGPPPIGPSGSDQSFYTGLNGQYIVAGGQNDVVWANTSNSVMEGTGNNDVLVTDGSGDYVHGTGNNDILTDLGSHDTLIGDGTSDILSADGSNDALNLNGASGYGWATGNDDSVVASAPGDTLGITGNDGLMLAGGGSNWLFLYGSDDTVGGGASNMIDMVGSNEVILDTTAAFNDTVYGFSQAQGDTIDLLPGATAALASSSLVEGGTSTLITLPDKSTITLIGVKQITNSIFT